MHHIVLKTSAVLSDLRVLKTTQSHNMDKLTLGTGTIPQTPNRILCRRELNSRQFLQSRCRVATRYYNRKPDSSTTGYSHHMHIYKQIDTARLSCKKVMCAFWTSRLNVSFLIEHCNTVIKINIINNYK